MQPWQEQLRTWWTWLREPLPQYRVARTVYLRVLAATSFAAFLSLYLQIPGLIGENGILPAAQFFQLAGQHFTGAAQFLNLPSLAWISSSTAALQTIAILGMVAAVLLFFNVTPRIMLLVQWMLYLSLVVAGQIFLSFQWDILLLETLFFTMFLAPATIRPDAEKPAPSRFSLYMLWFILFKLLFLSGITKLGGGDPVWRDLTALSYHYVTQPLPTPLAWFLDKLPVWMHQLSALTMYLVEISAPFMIWINDRFRYYAAGIIATFQLFIAATGNYAFFNILAIGLCLLLLKNQVYTAATERFPRLLHPVRTYGKKIYTEREGLPRLANLDTAALLLLAGIQLVVVTTLFLPAGTQPRPVKSVGDTVQPFRTVNTYGLFVDMTTTRPEIVVQGSQDGETWKTYEFKYKPGNVEKIPPVVAPHQPRLDWQMWFAALRQNPPTWFKLFTSRLLQGEEEVLALLEENPFPDNPPRFVRAVTYRYTFSNKTQLIQDGAWWERERTGIYLEPVSLSQR